MIDTRIKKLLNIFGLLLGFNFQLWGNSSLIGTYHFELEIRSTQIPKLPIKNTNKQTNKQNKT